MLTSKYVDYIALGIMAFSLSVILHSYLTWLYSLVVQVATTAIAVILLSGDESHHHSNKVLIVFTLATIGALFGYGYQ